MSFLIDGLRGSFSTRSGEEYHLQFKRRYATLEQIEAVNWDAPAITGECALPAGYGFALTDICYLHSTQVWEVRLKVSRQYLGDVAAYTEEVAQLKAAGEEKDQALGTLNAQLAEADETVIGLYEQLEGAQESAKVLEATKNEEIAARDEQLSAKDQEITEKNEQIAAKDEQISAKDQEISAKNQEIAALNQQLAEADETVISLYEQLEGAGETTQEGEAQV